MHWRLPGSGLRKYAYRQNHTIPVWISDVAVRGADMCPVGLLSERAMFLSPWVTGHRVLIECNKNKMNPLPRWFWPLRAAAHGAYRPEVVVCTHTPAQRHPSCIHASPHVTSGNPHPSRPVPTRPHPPPPLPTPPLAFLRPRDLRDPRATRQGRVRSDEVYKRLLTNRIGPSSLPL